MDYGGTEKYCPHFIRECLKVEELIREGKCKCNTDGKVVLPSGTFVPREIPGTLLSERIEEWHRRNPNQLGATSALLYSVEQPQLALTKSEPSTPPLHSFQLSTSDRIATIEAELYNLRARNQKFVPLVRTRAQRARAPIAEDFDDEDSAQTTRHPRIEEVQDEEDTQPVVVRKKTTIPDSAPVIQSNLF